MARLPGIIRGGSVLTPLILFLALRGYGRVTTPARVCAVNPGLLPTVALMEEVQEHARQVKAEIKQLVRMLVVWRSRGWAIYHRQDFSPLLYDPPGYEPHRRRPVAVCVQGREMRRIIS